MKIYDNGELIHVDSSKDIIEHFGIKGMKWGQKLVKMVETLLKPLKVLSLKKRWNVLSILQTSVPLKQKSNTRSIDL